jgi:hypothetical protein
MSSAIGGPGGRFSPVRSPPQSSHHRPHTAGAAAAAASPNASWHEGYRSQRTYANNNSFHATSGAAAAELSVLSQASTTAGRPAMRYVPSPNTSAFNNRSLVSVNDDDNSFAVRARSPPRWRGSGAVRNGEMTHTGSSPAAALTEPLNAARATPLRQQSSQHVGDGAAAGGYLSQPASPAAVAVTPILSARGDTSTVLGEYTPRHINGRSPRSSRGAPLHWDGMSDRRMPQPQQRHQPKDACDAVTLEEAFYVLTRRVDALEAERDSYIDELEAYRVMTGEALRDLQEEIRALRSALVAGAQASPPKSLSSNAKPPSTQVLAELTRAMSVPTALNADRHADGADITARDADAALTEILKQERDAARREATLLRERLLAAGIDVNASPGRVHRHGSHADPHASPQPALPAAMLRSVPATLTGETRGPAAPSPARPSPSLAELRAAYDKDAAASDLQERLRARAARFHATQHSE